MSKEKKELFVHPRWHTPDFGKTIAHREITFEESIRATKRFFERGILSKEEYNEEIEKIKKEYGIED